MMRRILLALLVALGLVLGLTAPAAAHHSPGAKISNDATSVRYIWADVSCLNGRLGSNPVPAKLYPGSSSDYYDKGWKVDAGYMYDAYRNGSRWRNNVVSDGSAVCIGSDSWRIVVVRYGPY